MDIWLQVHRENAARRLQQGPWACLPRLHSAGQGLRWVPPRTFLTGSGSSVIARGSLPSPLRDLKLG